MSTPGWSLRPASSDDYEFVFELKRCRNGRDAGSDPRSSARSSSRPRPQGKPLTLRVLHSNPRAAKLYASFGFEPFEETATHTRMRAHAAARN
jgi:hypothetical protein